LQPDLPGIVAVEFRDDVRERFLPEDQPPFAPGNGIRHVGRHAHAEHAAAIDTCLLAGADAADVRTLAVVSAVLIAVAIAASYFPARRATRVDPMIALRHE